MLACYTDCHSVLYEQSGVEVIVDDTDALKFCGSFDQNTWKCEPKTACTLRTRVH